VTLAWIMSAVIITQAEAPAAATQLIIWGGGKSEADGAAWLQRWADENPFTVVGWGKGDGLPEEWLRLAPGYPRVLRSDEVPGLQPGFFVVALGNCSQGEEVRPLSLVKAIYAGAYARAVRTQLPVACPQSQVEVIRTFELRHASGSVLVVTALAKPVKGPDDAPERGVLAHLRRGSGRLLDRRRAWEVFPYFTAAAMVVPTEAADAGVEYKTAAGCRTKSCCDYLVRLHLLRNAGNRISDAVRQLDEQIYVPCD
jgi:hypothetical protein